MILKLPSPPYIIVYKSQSTLEVTIICLNTLQYLIYKTKIYIVRVSPWYEHYKQPFID